MRIDPRHAIPWKQPTRLWAGCGLWLLAIVFSAFPSASQWAPAAADDQRSMDRLNQQTAAQLEETLLRELERIAEMAEMSPRVTQTLSPLTQRVTDETLHLKQSGNTRAERLATLSEIQAAIMKAHRDVLNEATLAELNAIGSVLANAESMEGIDELMSHGDLQQAAQQLEPLELEQLSEIERSTIAEQLESLAEQLQKTEQTELAAVVDQLQQGLEQGEGQGVRSAAGQLADLLRQQALQIAVQAELAAQLGQLSEAKGASLSGGDNTAESNEARQTWGHGKAGDPLSGQANDLQTTRVRETLNGVQGEGPTDRQVTRVEVSEGDAQRQLQASPAELDHAVEEVLRSEALPLGYRQTIRRYFRSIRPD